MDFLWIRLLSGGKNPYDKKCLDSTIKNKVFLGVIFVLHLYRHTCLIAKIVSDNIVLTGNGCTE
jgi:hypothetical protein